MPRVLKLVIAYDGTGFAGWQRQATGVSIQALVEERLARIEGAAVDVIASGRTDAGVHALGQVASVTLESTLDPSTLRRALNASLPGDVRIVSVEEMPAGFHARFSARLKTYHYRIVSGPFVSPFERRYAWHVPSRLDVAAMADAAAALAGTHDFAAFQASGSDVATTTRTVVRSAIASSEVSGEEHGEQGLRRITYEICGDGFLRHMVRAIVGTLVEVGSGRWRPDRMSEILASRDRGCAGPTAPAHGLFLVRVEY
jgi:tRNA pseudouridine38-40 synthase